MTMHGIVGCEADYSAQFVSAIRADLVVFAERSQLRKESCERIVDTRSGGIFQRFSTVFSGTFDRGDVSIPEKMRYKEARNWPNETRLMLQLSAHSVGVDSLV